jgi:hypothetical protein
MITRFGGEKQVENSGKNTKIYDVRPKFKETGKIVVTIFFGRQQEIRM